ncbi:MAG: hypothetical protein ACU833_03365 [Gammaproteobacteria bacterium]
MNYLPIRLAPPTGSISFYFDTMTCDIIAARSNQKIEEFTTSAEHAREDQDLFKSKIIKKTTNFAKDQQKGYDYPNLMISEINRNGKQSNQ